MCHHGLCSETVTLRISLNTEKEQYIMQRLKNPPLKGEDGFGLFTIQ